MDGPLIVYIIVGAFQILSVLGGGGVIAYRLGQSNQRLESAVEFTKSLSAQTTTAITELKADVAALRTVLTEVALQKAEIAQLRQWYDELRHGEGLVFPLGSRLNQKSGG